MYKWTVSISSSNEGLIHQDIIEAADLKDVKQQCLNICKCRLKEKTKLYLESLGKGIYSIVSDLDDVGQVKIERLIEKIHNT